MLPNPLKPAVLSIICLVLTAFCFAGNGDTLDNSSVNNSTKLSSIKVVSKKANVKYPEILEPDQEYFVSYVEKFSVNRRAYLMRTYSRSKKFFPQANVILKKYNVPSEFAVLLALESAFNANAVSSAGAVGYWQIMDDVAKEYGLKIATKQSKINAGSKNKKTANASKKPVKAKKSTVIDERKNFNKSTHTAAKYLRDRMRNLNNDWLLVAASYNWGVGNVWNAMERTGKSNPTFWDIKKYVPAETKSYVMNFIALNVVFKNYENFSKNDLCFKSENEDPCPNEESNGISDITSSLKR